MIKKSNTKRVSRRAPTNLRTIRSRPFEQVIQSSVTLNAATSSTVTNFTVATLVSDLSGASATRRMQLRALQMQFPPFNVLSTTTSVTPIVSVQLTYLSQANGIVQPRTTIVYLNTTSRTNLMFRLPVDISEVTPSNAGNIVQINWYNTAGAASVAYVIPVIIRSIWDLMEDTLV